MKKVVSILLVLCMAFSLAACGGTKTTKGSAGQESQKSAEETAKAQDGKTSEDGAGQESQAPDGAILEDAVGPAEPVVYGNEPNNLLQSPNAICVGEGRIYYINSDNQEIKSTAFDGSDVKTVGTVENVTRASSGAHCLNWYNGCIYYIITQFAETGSCYLEIRSMDPATGAETLVLQTETDGNMVNDGMLIIGDNLLYAGRDASTKKTTVAAFNLVTKEENQILETAGSSNGDVSFTSDGKYLYIFVPKPLYDVYRIALSKIYDSGVSCEHVVDERISVIILAENGYYATLENADTHEICFVFYDYKDSGADWQYEKLLDDVGSDGDISEEEIIPYLIWYSNMWPVGGSLVSKIKGNSDTLYYSPSEDYTQSFVAGEFDFSYGDAFCAGTYEDTLYLIVEGEKTWSFHTLSADGTYK